jgi:hypothetical protein
VNQHAIPPLDITVAARAAARGAAAADLRESLDRLWHMLASRG